MSESIEFKHLVRIHGKDLDGGKKIVVALSDIKGVGDNFAASTVSKLGLDPRARVGFLSEAQIQQVEKALQDPASLGLPQWFYNRKRDPETGESKQLLGSDLDLALKGDIDRESNQRSDPASLGLPQWFYNRKRDPETGESKQLLGSDLDLALKGDIDRESNQRSWKGIRHALGLKVRGQRTRTTGRKGRTVGVRKAALVAAAKQAAGEAKKEEKK